MKISPSLCIGLPLLTALLLGCSATKSEPGSLTDSAKKTPRTPEARTVPAAAKTDAFDYYGLETNLNRKIQMIVDASKSEGTYDFKLEKVGEDFAEYEVTYGGSLAELGNVRLRADKSGIRVLEFKGSTPVGDNFELPAGLTPGRKWENKSRAADESQASLSATNKVIGTTTVKTPVSEYKDALLVVISGTGERAKQKFTVESKSWFVKGRGSVKMELTQTSAGKTNKIVMQEIP